MKAIKQRPFAFSCCLFVFALFLGNLYGNAFANIIFTASASLFVLSFIPKAKPRFFLIYVIPALFFASVLSITFNVNYNNIQTFDNKECYVEFVPEREDYVSDTYSIYNVKIKSINGMNADFKANIFFEGLLDSPIYSSYSATVVFSTNDTTDSSSYKYSNLSDQTFINASIVGDIKDNKTLDKSSISYYFRKTNDFLSSLFQKNLSGDEYDLVNTLILGNKTSLSAQIKSDFQKLGLSHILAVSGLHLSILIASFGIMIGKLKINKKKKYLIMICLVFLYAGITGFSSSIKRAALMLIVFYLTFLLSKSSDSITSLCFSVAFICFFSPSSVFDIGLWLSAFSTYGILEVAIPITKKMNENKSDNIFKKCANWFCSSIILGAVPVMFSLPVIWLSYSEFSLLSPLSNIIFTPLLLAIMYSCPLLLFSSFFQPLAEAVSIIPHYSSKLMLYVADILTDYAPTVLLNYDFTAYLIIFLVVSYLIISLTSTKKKHIYFIPFLVASVIFTALVFANYSATRNEKKAVVTSTYDGESFLVISENKAILCDVSGGSPYNARSAVTQLKNNHISTLDGYIVTDYNAMTIDCLSLLSSSVNLSSIYLPSANTADEKLTESLIVSQATDLNIDVKYYDKNEQIKFHSISIGITQLSEQSINAPDPLCITFASDNVSYVYLGRGYDSTLLGKSEATKVFRDYNNFIFGTYGHQSSPHTLALRYKENANIFLTSDTLVSIYKNALPEDYKATITPSHYEFELN